MDPFLRRRTNTGVPDNLQGYIGVIWGYMGVMWGYIGLYRVYGLGLGVEFLCSCMRTTGKECWPCLRLLWSAFKFQGQKEITQQP